MRIRLLFLLLFFSINSFSHERPLSDLEKLDNTVKFITSDYMVYDSISYFIDFFEGKANELKDQARKAYQYRAKRKISNKRYKVEIVYQYYVDMFNSLKRTKEILKKKESNGLSEKEELILSSELKRMTEIQKNCPFRQ
jgi:hypothetical protein